MLQTEYNTFYYKKEIIEIVNNFCYLETYFSGSGTFNFALKEV